MSSKSAKQSAKKGTATKATKETKTTEKPVSTDQLEKDVRLVPIDEWDWDRVVFSEPVKKDIPDGSGKYQRVFISYRYDDKTIGPAIVGIGKHYCFGVQPDNVDKDGKPLKDDTGKPKPLRGYRVPVVLTGQTPEKPDPTPEEEVEMQFFEEWRNQVIAYACNNKKALGKGSKPDTYFEGQVGELLYYKRDKEGNPEEGVSPKLYTNLIYFTKSKECGTKFYGPGDKEINPLTMINKHFHIEANIRFDSIYIGGKSISLQHRVYDASVYPKTTEPKKRLARTNMLSADVEDTPTVDPSPEPSFESEASDDE
jgi:hypothetical protein